MQITLTTLQQQAKNNEKFTVLTCYDATFAKILEDAGIEVLLVGDSLGNVIKGDRTTLTVTLDEIIYHTQCVSSRVDKTFIMSDMPFGSYQQSPQQAFVNASKIIASGAHMVKLEGGEIMTETISFLTRRGIPVCAHIGLMPQSIYQLGGYRLQGNSPYSAKQLIEDAKLLEKAGASLLLMELVPAKLADEITQSLTIPTIGIGAGKSCSAQVLVLHDMLGLYQGKKLRFVKNFMEDADSIQGAIANYIRAVKSGQFPGHEHEY